MFIPNNFCYMQKKMPGHTGSGDALFGPRKRIPYSLVRFDLKVDDSTVRADSSATRGNVQEFHASGRILVPVSVKITWGDLLFINDQQFKVSEVEPRYNVLGILDHYEVDTVRSEKRK
jgi:hypothetical protein